MTTETLEINFDHFAERYALSIAGKVSEMEENELLELAGICMQSEDLDQEERDFFQCAYLILNKKNKKFIDLRKMKRMIKNGELGKKRLH
jgi:hypothetical protein